MSWQKDERYRIVAGSLAAIAVMAVAGVWSVCLAGEGAGLQVQITAVPGAKPLTDSGDIAARLVEGVDRFLLDEIGKSEERRAAYWDGEGSSSAKMAEAIKRNRQRLAHILGVRDARVPFEAPELCGTTSESPLIGKGDGYQVFALRWPAFGQVHGEGLLLVPVGREPIADMVAVPDADQTPEMLAGLQAGVALESQFARRLAESGCRVLVPTLVSRDDIEPALIDPKIDPQRRIRLSYREFLYRSAYTLGRHLIGYEVQKVLAGVDWFSREADGTDTRIGVIGWGEGGMLALYAAALDTRIDAVCVSGYFEPRENVWREPVYRNVFGLTERFGDAELAGLVCPRSLIVEAAHGPEVDIPPGTAGGPGRLRTPDLSDVRHEVARAKRLFQRAGPGSFLQLITSGDGDGAYGTSATLEALISALAPGARLAASGKPPQPLRTHFDPGTRHLRQVREIVRHNQMLLEESPDVRREFFSKVDTSSLENYRRTISWYRDFFYRQVVGRVDHQLLPPNIRSRKAYDSPKWTGYEVVMDVFPHVIAYGILLLPKDLRPGEKRPVVVCQHGLEGRAQDVVSGDHRAYHDFAARLAEQGFVTFAPQNLYLFRDRFRTLQRKANPLGKTLFSIIVPQHQQIVDWLQTLPYVDANRIAFYGLSYGGKSAMRVPALVTDYRLSICSAAFNDWVWKNAATGTAGRYSYVWTTEYEMFDFDLGSTFNHAEMAALICPRPFMVERGHVDGVAPDERVAYEFAKVRHLYAARLGIGDRCRIEWFLGNHTIHAAGSFEFLHKHLRWPKTR